MPDLCQDSNTSAEQELIYHSPATVRRNKKLQNNDNIYSHKATDPIDQAVRLLEHSAALLQ